MKSKILTFSSFFFLSLYSFTCESSKGLSFDFCPGFYVGFLGGYGSTTWAGLVPTKDNQNSALNLSTPILVKEGGGVWGLWAGYEFTPAFALETSYMRFPTASVFFDPDSLFSFDHNDLIKLVTKTETINVMGKIMLPISKTSVRLYSSAGLAGLHREDILKADWRLSPSFGLGVNYRLNQQIMAEIAGNYTAGYGESQLSPTDSYFPFLYAITARLSYHF